MPFKLPKTSFKPFTNYEYLKSTTKLIKPNHPLLVIKDILKNSNNVLLKELIISSLFKKHKRCLLTKEGFIELMTFHKELHFLFSNNTIKEVKSNRKIKSLMSNVFIDHPFFKEMKYIYEDSINGYIILPLKFIRVIKRYLKLIYKDYLKLCFNDSKKGKGEFKSIREIVFKTKEG